ncbi:MAG: metallophosphoesterase family protein [Nitrososphaerales archaeon]
MATRFLFASDIHSSETVWRKILGYAKSSDLDVVIGGDLCSSDLDIRFAIDEGSQRFKLGEESGGKIVNRDGLVAFQDRTRSKGSYCALVTRREYTELKHNKPKMEKLFKDVAVRELEKSFAEAESKLSRSGRKIYLLCGNDDYQEAADFVANYKSKVIVPFEDRFVELGSSHELLIGLGQSNPDPSGILHFPRQREEYEIMQVLRKISKGVEMSKTILVTHPPPHGTKLDVIDSGEHIGSTSVRQFIEEFEPIIGLHGHIHESPGTDYLVGRKSGSEIPVINPGSEYEKGILNGIVVEIEHGKLVRVEFIKQ